MATPAPATALTALDGSVDAAYTPAQLSALETVDGQGKKFIEIRTLLDETADDVDIESISNLLSTPDTTQIQTDLRALEAAAGQLFTVESGQAPGLKREIYDAAAPTERSQLMARLGFVLADGQPYIGPAKVVDLPALAQCRLGISIQTTCCLASTSWRPWLSTTETVTSRGGRHHARLLHLENHRHLLRLVGNSTHIHIYYCTSPSSSHHPRHLPCQTFGYGPAWVLLPWLC